MPYWVYILKSDEGDHYYIGQSKNPELRLEFHNSIEKGFTARYRPWRLVFTKECESREEAIRLEKKIKKWKSKIMIERLIDGEIEL